MPNDVDRGILNVLLDSWDRNNQILVNLLRAIPKEGLKAKVSPSSPSVAQLFTHIHFVRLVFLSEDSPAFAKELPHEEWASESDPSRIEQMLRESASAVREAVGSMVETGTAMQVHYDHPLLFLQHMVWHEGYHHGQIKLALKAAGFPLSNAEAGPLTWRIWMNRNVPPPAP